MSSSTSTSESSNNSSNDNKLRYIDAGANLLDSMYQGTYHDKPRHDPDLDIVLHRAYENGVHSIISLAGTLEESEKLMNLCEEQNNNNNNVGGQKGAVKVFGTVGVHPTRCAEVFAIQNNDDNEGGEDNSNNEENAEQPNNKKWTLKPQKEQDEIKQQLIELANRGKQSGNVLAIGEFGLDYARLHFCPKEIQHVGLRAQLDVACETNLPLYLHNRESGEDLMEILLEYKDRLLMMDTTTSGQQGGHSNSATTDGEKSPAIRGIVHSFDESLEIAEKFLSLGLYIGINGCSLKTQQNLDVVKEIPLESLILETDCPWCDIRPTHAGFSYIQTTFPCKKEKQYTPELGRKEGFCVKNRTEPCHVAQVAEVVAGLKGIDVKEVVEICCGRNVYDLFGSLDKK